MARDRGFSTGDMGLRIAVGVALVLVTYNPTRRSYIDWLIGHEAGERPYLALAGAVLLIAWIIYLRSTLRSIGLLGVALAGALLSASLWVLADIGVLSLTGGDVVQWAVLVATGVILGIGLSWSHVRRRLSGQSDVDDVDQ